MSEKILQKQSRIPILIQISPKIRSLVGWANGLFLQNLFKTLWVILFTDKQANSGQNITTLAQVIISWSIQGRCPRFFFSRTLKIHMQIFIKIVLQIEIDTREQIIPFREISGSGCGSRRLLKGFSRPFVLPWRMFAPCWCSLIYTSVFAAPGVFN